MGAPAAHVATTHSAHFPALQLCQESESTTLAVLFMTI
ncbi:hypothetical protein Y11_13811 [Yersinia enterocolitica subsp. palearctica Y11]|uniref:Uncharacterized protein n=1 Tax=Yersinia enterocolitica subsp. palearctica serotype O:3 (strain DSM 13030 / CIP 106945 / Y11) TaxID=930944 RepID=A0A0H3NNX5_YERE1|nr:hypothetical protein Y11_13811 [Yersinia enterocolitica subsp. palearctica Y11]CCO67734.1 hypothetical protein D322_838 [Yersinia enterocolitica IP 10393]